MCIAVRTFILGRPLSCSCGSCKSYSPTLSFCRFSRPNVTKGTVFLIVSSSSATQRRNEPQLRSFQAVVGFELPHFPQKTFAKSEFPVENFAQSRTHINYVRFEVFTAATMKNGILWDVTPCGSCKNRRFGGI
jgi:hypothetical protein